MSANWPRVPLGDVLQLQRRWVKVQPTEEYVEIGVRSFGKGIFHKAPRDGAAIGGKRVLRIEPGDLVFNNVFAWEGAVALAGPEESGTIGSHRFITYTLQDDQASAEYLRLFFTSEEGLTILRSVSPGSAGRNKTLSLARLLTQSVPLPPLAEQRRIVARVEAIAARVVEARGLREEATAEYDSLLVTLAHRADITEREKQQRGWQRVRLGEVLRQVTSPVAVRTDESYPNLGIYSFGRGLFEKPPIEGMTTSAATLYRVRAGQFIYSRLFAFEGAYGRVPPSLDGRFVSNEYPTFDCHPDRLRPEFISAYFRSTSVWADVATGSKGLGDRRQRVQPEQVLNHDVWLPPLAEQDRLVAVEAKADALRALQAKTAAELDALLPAVLAKAFAGEL